MSLRPASADAPEAARVDPGLLDLHCHILPGVDDGAPDVDASAELASAALASDIRTIAVTPHVREDYPLDPLSIPERTAALEASLRSRGLELRLIPAGEVGVTRAPQLTDDELAAVAIGGGPYILVESPYGDPGRLFENAVFELQARGYKPILAHPERSSCFLSDHERLVALIDRGALTSVTAASLGGRFGRTVRDFSLELLAAGEVHNVATDAHDLRDRRPSFAGATHALADHPRLARWLTAVVPSAIVEGAELPPCPETFARKRRLWPRRSR